MLGKLNEKLRNMLWTSRHGNGHAMPEMLNRAGEVGSQQGSNMPPSGGEQTIPTRRDAPSSKPGSSGYPCNGWENRETWVTWLWLANTEPLYRQVLIMISARRNDSEQIKSIKAMLSRHPVYLKDLSTKGNMSHGRKTLYGDSIKWKAILTAFSQ
jgi:hypothetical protein